LIQVVLIIFSNLLELAGPVAPENGPHSYIGPYTAIGDGTIVEGGEIEGSIVIGECTITCGKKIVDSLIGKGCSILAAKGEKPEGTRLIIGENSVLKI